MLITMSDKEIQRLAVLQDVRDQRITQSQAAQLLQFQNVRSDAYCKNTKFKAQLH